MLLFSVPQVTIEISVGSFSGGVAVGSTLYSETTSVQKQTGRCTVSTHFPLTKTVETICGALLWNPEWGLFPRVEASSIFTAVSRSHSYMNNECLDVSLNKVRGP